MYKSVVEIEQLLYRCCHAVDQGDIDTIMSVFHPEANLIIDWEDNGKYSGHEQIRQWFIGYCQVMKASMKYLRHKITCPLIEVNSDSDNAVAYSYLDVDAAQKDPDIIIIAICRYEDKLTKLDGQWYLMEKSIFMDDTYTIKR